MYDLLLFLSMNLSTMNKFQPKNLMMPIIKTRMRKTAFIFCLTIFFIITTLSQNLHAQYIANDLYAFGLIDSVGSVREFQYSISTDPKSSDRKLISTDQYYTFNINGNLTEVLSYQKGRLFSTKKFEYDNNGRKTGYQEYDAQDRLYLVVVYEYDKESRIISEIFDRTYQKMFDDRRKEIDVEYYKYYKNLYTKINYKYNVKDMVIAKEYFKPDSSLSYRNEYEYNYKDFLVKRSHFNEDDKMSWQEKISNDLLANPIKIRKFRNHRIVSETIVEYEFDRHKNWINRIETTENPDNIFGDESNNTSVTTIREIEYYKTSPE